MYVVSLQKPHPPTTAGDFNVPLYFLFGKKNKNIKFFAKVTLHAPKQWPAICKVLENKIYSLSLSQRVAKQTKCQAPSHLPRKVYV